MMDAIMIATAIMIIENYDIDNNDDDDACHHLGPYEIGSLCSLLEPWRTSIGGRHRMIRT